MSTGVVVADRDLFNHRRLVELDKLQRHGVASTDKLLVLSGSCSDMSAKQIQTAEKNGFVRIRLGHSLLLGEDELGFKTFEERVCQVLANGQSAVVCSIDTELPHANTAWERFAPQGPLALLPFRDAHETVAHAVKAATSHNCDLSELPLSVLQSFHASIDKDVFDCLSLRGSLNARNTLGGTAPAQVKAQIARHRARLA